ncbi:hypothetical protein SUGI_0009780 [Cryptomeria japonica]|nr:hypothetical protein SUGI_0009780 [Cryptomeria japonica]
MANRDRPVNGKRSRLHLQKDGDFVLLDADGSAAWTTNTQRLGVKKAELLPEGNLVLRSSSGKSSGRASTRLLIPSFPSSNSQSNHS